MARLKGDTNPEVWSRCSCELAETLYLEQAIQARDINGDRAAALRMVVIASPSWALSPRLPPPKIDVTSAYDSPRCVEVTYLDTVI